MKTFLAALAGVLLLALPAPACDPSCGRTSVIDVATGLPLRTRVVRRTEFVDLSADPCAGQAAAFAFDDRVVGVRRGFLGFGRRVDVFAPGVNVEVSRFGRVHVIRDNLGASDQDRKKKPKPRPKRDGG